MGIPRETTDELLRMIDQWGHHMWTLGYATARGELEAYEEVQPADDRAQAARLEWARTLVDLIDDAPAAATSTGG